MRRHIRRGAHIHRLLILGIAAFAVPHSALAAPRNAPVAAPRNAPVVAPSISAADREMLLGPWTGAWTATRYRYDVAMALNVDETGNVEGTIAWTLRESPSPFASRKVGMNATEYVHGKYYPDSETLILEGYRKDDPNTIIELDKYRLVVSPTGLTMGGITEEHGAWNGQFFLSR
jgi:hypothetical protein